MMNLKKVINILMVIFVIVILMHIPNNLFDLELKVYIRTVQISIAIIIFILYFIDIYLKKEQHQ
ncbi:hypothetical protein [Macrococcus armenti]|uniref:hypothetical protein n=1 Tax=Macrococcus armenti TaxID=2875764 RepID=UPI001CCC1042|nr:hypothetical protein [Macrococcus armenti]UBH09213.1 hypothetical protein LAU41_03325 [Macrococcus armenti]UBH11509.1 hypothetical protein LAU38_03320 [Macrococcus armenti]UBH15972.1 hypothetical protein LAU44_03220 [Macrococcus armenti]UBH18333.1 hypothetical protein LAU39_03230 [Macrococcus armenti]UBH20599.1 hypothetical protein LAU40_03220 [Macrococcus armenti]